MSQDLNNVTTNASMNESNPDVINSSSTILTDAQSMNVTSNVVTSTYNILTHDTDSVFFISEPSITFPNQLPRKRAKSFSYESVGTHQNIPPLHGEIKNAPCPYTDVTLALTSVDLHTLNDNQLESINDNRLNEDPLKVNTDINETTSADRSGVTKFNL